MDSLPGERQEDLRVYDVPDSHSIAQVSTDLDCLIQQLRGKSDDANTHEHSNNEHEQTNNNMFDICDSNREHDEQDSCFDQQTDDERSITASRYTDYDHDNRIWHQA